MPRARVLQRRLRLRRRVGRRGASLLFLGLLCLIFAFGLAYIPPTLADSAAYRFIGHVMPLQAWAAIWLLTGTVCMVQAFMIRDRIAFGLSVALLLTWGGMYAVGWTFYDIPRAYVLAAVYLAFGSWIFIISGWAEQVRTPSALDEAANAVITADSTGIIRSWNLAAEEMFGWSAHDVLDQPLMIIIPERYRYGHQVGIERVRITGRSELAGRSLPLVGLCRDGSEINIELTITAWRATDGTSRFTGIISHLPPEAPSLSPPAMPTTEHPADPR